MNHLAKQFPFLALISLLTLLKPTKLTSPTTLYEVHRVNGLSSNAAPLVFRCQSRTYHDLGYHRTYIGGDFHWKFAASFWGSICSFASFTGEIWTNLLMCNFTIYSCAVLWPWSYKAQLLLFAGEGWWVLYLFFGTQIRSIN